MKLPRAPGDKRVLVVDLETFPNWFCIAISDGEHRKVFASHRAGDILRVAKALNDKNVVVAGFNNKAYDDIILRAIVADPSITPAKVNRLSARIIDPQDKQEEDANFRDTYSPTPWAYSIDVFQLLNGKGSLKEHACRSNALDVGESPYPFREDLPSEGYAAVERYCGLDVTNTAEKLASLWPLVKLREKLTDMFDIGDRIYGLSEQGIAQATFLKLHRDRSGQYAAEIRKACQESPENLAPVWDTSAIVSKRVRYSTKPFQKMLEMVLCSKLRRLDDHGAKWELETLLPEDLVQNLAGCRFQLGVGGLHSIDKPGIFRSSDDVAIIDLDVTSYYPSIIINERLYPAHIGPGFVDDMRKIFDRRVAAKRRMQALMAERDKLKVTDEIAAIKNRLDEIETELLTEKTASDALKIVANATFGKLNDVWSPLRSVPNAMRVTLNGQLFLLMLVEKLTCAGFTVLSANTDGVTLQARPMAMANDGLGRVVKEWEAATGYTLERTDYTVYARRDVNSYVACKADGKVKTKGAFHPDTGKGDGLIVKRAAVAFLTKGTPIVATVMAAKLEELTYYQRCKNGGTLIHGEKPIGKLARWYASTDGEPIRRVNPNGTKALIPNAHKATLVMSTNDVGTDIDFDHYIREAEALVASCTL